jgi:cytochrome c oxidase subunit II
LTDLVGCAAVQKGALLKVTLIALAVAAITTAIAVFLPWLPASDSKEGDRIDFDIWVTTAICILVWAVVAGIFIYSVIAFRAKPDDDTDGPPVHGHTGLEITWTAIPFVLVTAIGIMSAVILAKNGDTPKNALKVNVLGEQFAWNFTYPTYNNLQSTTLRLPINRTTKLEMTSRDVLHSFYVPEFRQKQDLVPGQTTTINVTPTKLGHYVIQCAELCGLGHAVMLGEVLVMSQPAFEKWAKGSTTATAGGGAAAGKALFTNNGCASCHTFAPAGASGKVGPDLDKLPQYAQQAGKPLEAFVRESIEDPSAYIQPGYKNLMPSFKSLPAQQIDQLVSFLTKGASS